MEIELTILIDLDSDYVNGGSPWTFFAWPSSAADKNGLPVDQEARQYLAAVQRTGVPIGIWRNSPAEGTNYAGVVRESIQHLNQALAELTQFGDSYASDLCERLFEVEPPEKDSQ